MTGAARTPAQSGALRRVLLLVGALFLLEQALYASITPLLPYYVRTLGLSKTGAGVLTGAYMAGLIPGSLLGAWWSNRLGVRRTALAGLLGFAAATVAFGFASTIAALDGLRAAQGLASGCIWSGALTWLMSAAPRDERGRVIGGVLGVAVLGTLLGPAIGTLAVLAGTGPVFAAVGALAVAMAAVVVRMPAPPPPDAGPRTDVRRALGHRLLAQTTWVVALEALGLGVVTALVPLRLTTLGATEIGVGSTFLLASAATVLAAPVVGRLADRHGRRRTLRFGLVATAPWFAALAYAQPAVVLTGATILAVGGAFGGLSAPSFALLTDAAEDAGLSLAVGSGLLNVAWALGETVGAPAGAGIAQHTSDAVPFLAIAGLLLLTACGLRRSRVASAALGT